MSKVSKINGISIPNTFVTGFTYDTPNKLTISQNGVSDLDVYLNQFSGVTITGKTITGELQVTGGTLTTGYILTSDGVGNATWSAPTTVSGYYLPLSGGTVTGATNFTGGLSANTISATTYYNLPTFTGNTSATCITDLYVTNLNSCSPLHIQPLSGTGDVYIGENGGVNVGIGTSTPSSKLEVNGDIKIISQSNILKIGSYSALSITQGVGAPNVIVGHNNTMNDGGNGGGVVIGSSSTSTDNGIAIGLFSTVSLGTTDGIAIGRDTSISNSSIRGVAIGRQATVTANNAFAIGNYTTANQDDTIILGNNSSGVKPNVGIGTSAPNAKLHISGTSSETLKVESSNAGSGVMSVHNQTISAIELISTSTSDKTLSLWGYHGVGGVIKSKGSLLFRNYTNNTQYAQVDNIDSNPSWGFGNQLGSGSPSIDTRIRIVGQDSSSSNYGLKVQDSGGTDNLVVRNDGNVGIGTGSPSAKLNVSGDSIFDQSKITINQQNGIVGINIVNSGESMYQLTNSATDWCLIGKTPSEFYLYNYSPTPITFYTNQIERMIISSTGNVGIGTSTPSEKLDVSGKTKTINFQMTSGATNGYVLTSDSSGNASWLPQSGSTTSFTGGTVTGATNFTGGLSANTISATTITGTTIYGDGSNLTNIVTSLTTSTGLSASTTTGNITILNTAPDQTVTISEGSGMSVTGTYPNFTIANTGGTVTGATNFTGGLSANTLTITTPPTTNYDNTQLLTRNSTTGNIELTNASSPSIFNYGLVFAISSGNYLQ